MCSVTDSRLSFRWWLVRADLYLRDDPIRLIRWHNHGTLCWCYFGFNQVMLHERHGVSNHRQLHCLFSPFSSKQQRKHQYSTLLGYSGILVDSPYKGPVMREAFPWHDIIVIQRTKFYATQTQSMHAVDFCIPSRCICVISQVVGCGNLK